MSVRKFGDWTKHSTTSARVDLAIDNNGTWMDAFQFGEQDDTTWTLNDMTFELDVQRNAYDLIPLLSLTSDNARIVVDDATKRVLHFDVAAEDIQASLTPGTYLYDLVMVDAQDRRVPLMHGSLEVTQGVTYPP